MDVSEADPDDLEDFEETTREALGELYSPALDLAEKLQAVRSDPDAEAFLPNIPYIHHDVLSLYSVGRELASWVGDVGRAFREADLSGDGEAYDVLIEAEGVSRLGNDEFTVLEVNGRTVIDTGNGDDEVTVEAVDGGVKVTVGDEEQVFTGNEASNLTIRLGAGNDQIVVDTDVDLHFTIEGQDGDDHIEGGAGDERILGGDGRDYVDGFSGNDSLDGGLGNDVIYSGDGDDIVYGGDGVDYLEGGTGADTILGGAHDDVISGGDDADRLDGQGGDDVIYTGEGDDQVTDYQGDNTAYAQWRDDDIDLRVGESSTYVVNVDLSGVPGDSALKIEGSSRFQQRMLQDLQMLRSSPDGRQMLLAMDDIHEDTKAIAADWPVLGSVAYQGDTITIKESDDDGSHASYDDYVLWRNNEVEYNTSKVEMYPGTYTPRPGQIAWQEAPPVVILFHELAHQYDYGYETSIDGDYQEPSGDVPNSERQAVGLPVDHDDDPSTPEQVDPDHPIEYTENGLRDEMGLPDRTTYGPP